jgi:hypothetical protein
VCSITFSEKLRDKLQFLIGDKDEWTVLKNNVVIKKGRGKSLVNFTFKKPGEYQVNALVKHSDDHGSCKHPDILHSIQVNVSSVKIIVDFNSSYWHTLFTHTKVFTNDTILVPMTIQFYKNPTKLSNVFMNLSGVDCNLRGIIAKDFQLYHRKNSRNIPFVLNGTVGTNIYASVDFFDHAGNSQSYPILHQIREK